MQRASSAIRRVSGVASIPARKRNLTHFDRPVAAVLTMAYKDEHYDIMEGTQVTVYAVGEEWTLIRYGNSKKEAVILSRYVKIL